jgi:EAL domain-containing protein (putative c-di-GMP-specific phosphodiesterase class I)
MTLESALRRAVRQKDFVLHYQPQINLETGEIIAVEALVRWVTQDSGTVMPADFIPLAEETGLINEIGEWVLREGCRQAKEWQDIGLSKTRRMAINLSARQFSDKGFLDMVTRVLAETGLAPACLELEITESQVMRQTEGMIQLLNRLSAMGIQLAIDDFGTGYSSLSYLKRLPIQKLKIDQSFIRDITVDPNDTAIVVAIINMAKSLELETIAEGVETAGQLALLRSKECKTGQGFFFSAPVSAQEIYPMLRANNLSGGRRF